MMGTVRSASTGATNRPLGPLNPFEGYLLLAALLQGVAVLAGVAHPSSIQALLPTFLLYVWGALLTIGGGLSLAGLLWPRDPFTAIEIKRFGLYSAGLATLAYGAALISVGPPGYVAGITNVSFTVACAVRIWQIGRALRVARAYLAEVRKHRPSRK